MIKDQLELNQLIADYEANNPVFIDFLGYYPNTTYLVCREENKGLFCAPSKEILKEKIKQQNWTVVPNPRFKDFPAHLDFVEELNNI